MASRVVNLRNEKYDVYIGRPSKWGNPFVIGAEHGGEVLTRESCIEAFRNWILNSDRGIVLQADLWELYDKRLGCFCAPGACHGDVLAEMAERLLHGKTVSEQTGAADAAWAAYLGRQLWPITGSEEDAFHAGYDAGSLDVAHRVAERDKARSVLVRIREAGQAEMDALIAAAECSDCERPYPSVDESYCEKHGPAVREAEAAYRAVLEPKEGER